MKRNSMKLASAIALGIAFTSNAFAQDVTQAEKEKALRYLGETRDALTDAVKGLSEAQWKFKPAPDRWSIAEIVEHLAILENLFANALSVQLKESPAGNPDRDFKSVDAIILAKVPDRSTKVKAPEALTPAGRWAPNESLKLFLTNRQETISFLTSAADLRGHVMNHPALGPLDAYEWVLAVAAHTERHTKQILEVKADHGFPVN